MNTAFYRNLQGAAQATLAFIGGAVLWAGLGQLHLTPATDTLTTSLCIISLSAYLLTITSAAYQRNINLRDTRRELRHSEQALNTANANLHAQLDEVQKLQALLKEQANRDPLTGLYNRRYLDSVLTRELGSKRDNQPVWILLIDIDHFKRVNDNYGHPAGDEVLKSLAQLLLDQARAEDVVCRFGGEEFLLMLPRMPAAIALARAEQWREAFANSIVTHGDSRIQATLSIGMANYPEHGLKKDVLIGNVDRALYRAKAEGRNRVITYSADLA